MDQVYRFIVGIVLILAGLGWIVLRILDAAAGDPNEGQLGGWGPVLAGLGVAALGVIVLVF